MKADLPLLAARALHRVESVRDDPSGRLGLRERFYEKYSFSHLGHDGFGNSEIAFLKWEIERGVLNPLHDADRPGSPWWRSVNLRFLYDGELASLIHEAQLPLTTPGIPHSCLQWLRYLQAPTGTSWYRAHNTSITQGYLDCTCVAQDEEGHPEQTFMNVVLYRVFYAQAMEEGAHFAFGFLGRLLAEPELPAVNAIVDLPAFYPRHYPLSPGDIRNVLHHGHSLEELGADVLDRLLILPELGKLYELAAGWNGIPETAALERHGKPIYPNYATAVIAAGGAA